MSWSKWVQTVHTQPEDVPALIDRQLDLKQLGDPGQAKAIIQAMQNRPGSLFFLEGEAENEELIVFEQGDDWYVREWPGEDDEEDMALFINYTTKLSDLISSKKDRKQIGEYYSLRPLIYGGEFWLENICADEITRYKDLDGSEDLAVFLISMYPGQSLFDTVESLRRGDRVGYFGREIGILLPFTSRQQAGTVRDRLKDEFQLESFRMWMWGDDFENHFELKTNIEEQL